MRPTARKQLGQHFLHDPAVIAKIIREIAPQRDDCIVEIGGGLGALTAPLLERIDVLHVVEVDERLAEHLEGLDTGDGHLMVHRADALKFDFASLRTGSRRLRIVGNLPYNISTPLLFHLLEQRSALVDLHVMLQKEVAARIVAKPGTKDYGRLTVMLAAWMAAESCFDVGPGAFSPPPRVWSTVLRLTPQPEARFPIADEKAFANFVRRVFSMRRKTLGRALKGLLTPTQIESQGIDPATRGETLAPAQLAALASLL